ncbi:hypothetical protein EDD18DRAFT_1083107 [Armillaria luteobubalina]|uniref:Uncharacterized protein n=1 Tax=Armillaria luteobubalina TaxID=153913 RepID=A0AA39PK73_9AGAR|nr:hypothetical protein EDD18DRAFT_1083107 [Armillaria luteobubalina]
MLAQEYCRLGCRAIESPHHIFMECPDFPVLRAAAESFLSDCSTTWPLTDTQFYLGHIPPLDHCLPQLSFNSRIVRNCVLRNVHSAWHLVAVRLTGRIYGDLL